MDSKGRPTRLEDIITGDSIIQIALGDTIVEGKQIKGNPEFSLGILKSLSQLADKLDNSPTVWLSSIMDNRATILGIMRALIVCVDRAIKQKAEEDEIIGMMGGDDGSEKDI